MRSRDPEHEKVSEAGIASASNGSTEKRMINLFWLLGAAEPVGCVTCNTRHAVTCATGGGQFTLLLAASQSTGFWGGFFPNASCC